VSGKGGIGLGDYTHFGNTVLTEVDGKSEFPYFSAAKKEFYFLANSSCVPIKKYHRGRGGDDPHEVWRDAGCEYAAMTRVRVSVMDASVADRIADRSCGWNFTNNRDKRTA
jgi:hypothetical protein